MCWEVVPTHLRSCTSCFVAGHPRLGWEPGPSLTGLVWMHLMALSVFQQSFYAPERTDTCVPPRKARLHVLLLIWNDVSPSLQNGHLLFGFLVVFGVVVESCASISSFQEGMSPVHPVSSPVLCASYYTKQVVEAERGRRGEVGPCQPSVQGNSLTKESDPLPWK